MTVAARCGADPASLRAGASALEAVVARLATLGAECDVAVRAARWTGDDADELRLVWRSVRTSFEEVAASTASFARRLATEAEEQEIASAGGG